MKLEVWEEESLILLDEKCQTMSINADINPESLQCLSLSDCIFHSFLQLKTALRTHSIISYKAGLRSLAPRFSVYDSFKRETHSSLDRWKQLKQPGII